MPESKLVPVNGVDTVGIIRDTPAHALPPNAWSDGRNIRFKDGTVRKREGTVQAFTALPNNTTARTTTNITTTGFQEYASIAYWPAPREEDRRYIEVVLDTTTSTNPVYRIYTVDDETKRVDITPAVNTDNNIPAGGLPQRITQTTPSNFSYNIENGDWNFSLFTGGYNIILNNGFHVPVYVNPGTSPFSLVPLPGWNYDDDRFISAKVVRGVGNRLIAGNFTHRLKTDLSDSENFPGTIRISTLAAAGEVPTTWEPLATNTADEFDLSDTSAIQDIVPLQGQAIVYTNDSIHSVDVRGADATVRTVAEGYGALTTNAVLEFDGRHLVVGSDDIYIFGGHPGSIQSVADGKIREFFYNDLSPLTSSNLFMVRDKAIDEIQIFYPSILSVDGTCDRYLAWNYRNNTWAINDTPGIRNNEGGAVAGVVGPIRGGGIVSGTIPFSGYPNVHSDAQTEQQTLTLSLGDNFTSATAEVQDFTVSGDNATTFVNEELTIGFDDDIQPSFPEHYDITFPNNFDSGTPNRALSNVSEDGEDYPYNNIAGVNGMNLTVESTSGGGAAMLTSNTTVTTVGTVQRDSGTITNVISGGLFPGTSQFRLRFFRVTFADGTQSDVPTAAELTASHPATSITMDLFGTPTTQTQTNNFQPANLPDGLYVYTNQSIANPLGILIHSVQIVRVEGGTATNLNNFSLDPMRIVFIAATNTSNFTTIPLTIGTRSLGINVADPGPGDSTTYTLEGVPMGATISLQLGGTGDATGTGAIDADERTFTGNGTLTFADADDERSFTATGSIPAVPATGTLLGSGNFQTASAGSGTLAPGNLSVTDVGGFNDLTLAVTSSSATAGPSNIGNNGGTSTLTGTEPGTTGTVNVRQVSFNRETLGPTTTTVTNGTSVIWRVRITGTLVSGYTATATPRVTVGGVVHTGPVQTIGINALSGNYIIDASATSGFSGGDVTGSFSILGSNPIPNPASITRAWNGGNTTFTSANRYRFSQTSNTLRAGWTSAGVGYTTSPALNTITNSSSMTVSFLQHSFAQSTYTLTNNSSVDFTDVTLTIDSQTASGALPNTGSNTLSLTRSTSAIANGDAWQVDFGTPAQWRLQSTVTGLAFDSGTTNFPGGLTTGTAGAAALLASLQQATLPANVGVSYAGSNMSAVRITTVGATSPAWTLTTTANDGSNMPTGAISQAIGSGTTEWQWTIEPVSPTPAFTEPSGGFAPVTGTRMLSVTADGDLTGITIAPSPTATSAQVADRLATAMVEAANMAKPAADASWTATAAAPTTTPEGHHAAVININNTGRDYILSVSIVTNNGLNLIPFAEDRTSVTAHVPDGFTVIAPNGDTVALTAASNETKTNLLNRMVTAINGPMQNHGWTASVNNGNLRLTHDLGLPQAANPGNPTDTVGRWVATYTRDSTASASDAGDIAVQGVINGAVSSTVTTVGGPITSFVTLVREDGLRDTHEFALQGHPTQTGNTLLNTVRDQLVTALTAANRPFPDWTFAAGTADGTITVESVAADWAIKAEADSNTFPFRDTEFVNRSWGERTTSRSTVGPQTENVVTVTAASGRQGRPAVAGSVVSVSFTDSRGNRTNISSDPFPSGSTYANETAAAQAVATLVATLMDQVPPLQASTINDANGNPTIVEFETQDFGQGNLNLMVTFDEQTDQTNRNAYRRRGDTSATNPRTMASRFSAPLLTGGEARSPADLDELAPFTISESSSNDPLRPWRVNSFNFAQEYVMVANSAPRDPENPINGVRLRESSIQGYGFGYYNFAAPVGTLGENSAAKEGTPYSSYVERIHNPMDGEFEFTKMAESVQILLSDGDVDVQLGMTDAPGRETNLYDDENGMTIPAKTFFRDDDYKIDWRRHGRLFNIRITDPTTVETGTMIRPKNDTDPATGWRIAGYGLSIARVEKRGGRAPR